MIGLLLCYIVDLVRAGYDQRFQVGFVVYTHICGVSAAQRDVDPWFPVISVSLYACLRTNTFAAQWISDRWGRD